MHTFEAEALLVLYSPAFNHPAEVRALCPKSCQYRNATTALELARRFRDDMARRERSAEWSRRARKALAGTVQLVQVVFRGAPGCNSFGCNY